MSSTPELRSGLAAVSTPEEDGPNPFLPTKPALDAYLEKHETLRGIPAPVIRKAWFTMAHLIVNPGATVVDMGCLPAMTYAMAVLNPQVNFTGINTDKKLIASAVKNYRADNLSFAAADIQGDAGFRAGSVDAVINSFILHEIFSHRKYSERAVVETLEAHFGMLKQEGLMFVRDFAMPPPEEFVLLEMPEAASKSQAIEDLSEVDLLIWYAEHARPLGGKLFKGFFLEELPPRMPKTRLFRLPHKWAYEFIMHKDNRKDWLAELDKEYSFFTQHDFRKTLRSLGARVLYTAPLWDDGQVRDSFDGHFRLYSEDGKLLGAPSTSFVAIAQKMGEKNSLNLHELRPSPSMDSRIRITAMRNEANGKIFDVISRDMDITEVIPYRVTPEGALNVFIHDGLPRGIANAVPRSGRELDGKRWSGHMIEAIAVPTDSVYEAERGEHKEAVMFARDHLGLKPAMGCLIEKGTNFYPAPDLIDEQVKTRYLRVVEHEGAITPKSVTEDLQGFSTKGVIREVSAQSLLNAISVGFLPNARLETQILDLYEMLKLSPETWDECPLSLDFSEPEMMLDTRDLLNRKMMPDKRFKDVKGTTGQVRAVKSIFIDEGWVEGGITGLTSCDIDFVISDDKTVNKVVILPLTKHAKSGDVLAGLVTEYLPIPQRHTGNGLSLRMPSFTLPKEVTSVDQAKQFIAEKFDVKPDRVARLGESYFCHIGLTPVRIFPFAVSTTGKFTNPFGGPITYAPLVSITHMMWRCDDYKQDRFILTRFDKVYRLNQNAEVTGNWAKNTSRHYAEIAGVSGPAVMQSSDVSGLGYGGGAAPAPSTPAAPANAPSSPLAAVVAAEKPPPALVTSPDFVDVRHDSGKGGATYSSHIAAATSKAPAQAKDGKYKTK